MSTPHTLGWKLALPVIAAPMFLVSGPQLVIASMRAGIVGTFPALNQRTTEGYIDWVNQIRAATADLPPERAVFGVNMIVHPSNTRLEADMRATVAAKVPLIITSLGAVKELVGAVQGYGGLVFHDVINLRHARKAAEANVDGLIGVCAGAGGHAGLLSPFALIPEIRKFFPKTILLSGVMSSGRHVAAAKLIGADLAYLGTRFIAVKEGMADQRFKQMIVDTNAADIVYTAAISGVHGNFLMPSIAATGKEIDLNASHKISIEHEGRAWKDVWSAGQGVGSIDDMPSTAELCARLIKEYREAIEELADERAAIAAQ